MNPFAWLRRKAAESVVMGVSDGLAAVTPAGDDPPQDLDGLRRLVAERLAPKALEAAQDESQSRKRRT